MFDVQQFDYTQDIFNKSEKSLDKLLFVTATFISTLKLMTETSPSLIKDNVIVIGSFIMF